MEELKAMLQRSEQSVFTHADLAPRNIIIDQSTFEVTGILDWECAGWYPAYWEYTNMWRGFADGTPDGYDWCRWMDRSNPFGWTKEHIRGINASRRVLIS